MLELLKTRLTEKGIPFTVSGDDVVILMLHGNTLVVTMEGDSLVAHFQTRRDVFEYKNATVDIIVSWALGRFDPFNDYSDDNAQEQKDEEYF